MKKKIAIITSGYFPVPPVRGGAIESLINLIIEENNIKEDVDLTVYSMYDAEAEAISNCYCHTKVKYIKIPGIIRFIDVCIYCLAKNLFKKKKHMSYRYIMQRLYFINRVSKDISCSKYDKLIFQNHPTLLGVLKKYNNLKKYKGKFYYHAHNEIYNTFGNDELLKMCNKIICVSHFIENSISSFLHIDDPAKFVVLRNRVDEDRFRNIKEEKIYDFMNKYSIPIGYTLFTFTGRLNPEKGVKELLLAYKLSRPKNSKLIIAGSYYFGSGMKSNYESELEHIAEDIKEEIIFTGNIAYDDMPLLYHISDVIVVPSIWNDPAPLTVIESLTCGKPLITTYSGGIPEYANKNNSLIFEIDDELVDKLVEGIRILSEDEITRKRLADVAFKESKKWTKESFYDDFIKCLD